MSKPKPSCFSSLTVASGRFSGRPRLALLVLVTFLSMLTSDRAHGQLVPPPVAQNNPMAQRNAKNLVLNQVRWFQNATRTSGAYVGGGCGMLLQQFTAVRDQYANLKTTLSPRQLNVGANQIADLDAGLDIIQEAFGDYQTEVANGQSEQSAFNNLRLVLGRAMGVWVAEFRQVCDRLRVGW